MIDDMEINLIIVAIVFMAIALVASLVAAWTDIKARKRDEWKNSMIPPRMDKW